MPSLENVFYSLFSFAVIAFFLLESLVIWPRLKAQDARRCSPFWNWSHWTNLPEYRELCRKTGEGMGWWYAAIALSWLALFALLVPFAFLIFGSTVRAVVVVVAFMALLAWLRVII